MKKIVSYILISVILLANFLAPFSVGLGTKNQIQIEKNEARAADEKPKVNASVKTSNKTIEVTVEVIWQSKILPSWWKKVEVTLNDGNGKFIITKEVSMQDSPSSDNIQKGIIVFGEPENITADTPYQISTSALRWTTELNPFGPMGEKLIAPDISGKADPDPITFKTQPTGTTNLVSVGNQNTEKDANIYKDTMPACNMNPLSKESGTFVGCVAQTFYYVFFMPTSYLFALAGTFFDYTFAYSVQDTSYRSAFVVEGWGLIRDFCNMFFIFIMLYVAIGTILSLHSMKTKETIINIVIIGLFINFSLFATQVIIDASNITAKVFYNSNAIKITEKDANGVIYNTPGLEVEQGGIIPLSAALVNKINPQNLIINSRKATTIPVKGGSGDAIVTSGNQVQDKDNMTAGTFILIVLMTSAINVVGFVVFLTIGFLFVSRVIGLWLAMILSPLAFFTYILPSMAKTKMIGWEHWWEDTLKLAFLAPVFIFFMYLVLKFLQIDLIADPMNKTGLAFFVATIIPFVFIMIFMIKAKKIAVDMSGEFGEMAVKAGSAVGGLALGGAIGAGAFAMRGTIGKMGNALAESKFAKTNGRFGRMLGDAGKWTSGKSFDVRNTSFGAAAGKGMGVDMSGKEAGMDFVKAQEGGYKKYKADVQKKREERAKSLEVGHDEHEMHDLHEKEEGLQALKNAKATDLTAIQGKIDAWGLDSREKDIRATQLEQELERAEKAGTATDTQRINAKLAREKAMSIAQDLQDAKDEKDRLRNDTKDGVVTSVSQKSVDVSKKDAEKAEEEAIAAEASVTGIQETLTNIPKITQAAIKKAKDDAKAIADKANDDAKAAIDKANDDAKAAIDKAQADAQTAKQTRETAEERRYKNPTEENIREHEKAKNNEAIAQTNLASITNRAPIDAKAAIDKANDDAKAIADKANDDAKAAIDKANDDAKAAIDKAEIALDIAKEMAKKKKTSANTKKARATELETAHINKKKIARSMNELEFQEVPEAKQVVTTINAGRKNDYATEIKKYWFNHNANEHAAHNIRMNAEIKSDGKVGGH